MELLGVINSAAVVGALFAAIWQLAVANRSSKTRDESHRTERALALHKDLVAEGPTAEAFHRLSVFLRREGSAETGLTTWRRVRDSDLDTGGLLDPSATEREQLFADLYTVLWYFERTEISLTSRIVNLELLMQTLGFHFWWWGQILWQLEAPKSSSSIHILCSNAQTWALRTGNMENWLLRCVHDFDGGPGQNIASPRISEPERFISRLGKRKSSGL